MRRGNTAVRAETLRRLQVEKSRLVGVSGWVVLGIPENSPPDLIAQAGSRMRRRYRHLAARPDLDPECRQIAREIEGMVDRAEALLSQGGSDSLQGAGESLLEIGKRLIAARDWVRADRALARAAEQSLSNPEVLANHGWARLNNPERPEAERRLEGRDLLLLTEQLDPRCLTGQLYLARYYVMCGDAKRALMRADRALRIAPGDPEAQLLVQECRSLVG